MFTIYGDMPNSLRSIKQAGSEENLTKSHDEGNKLALEADLHCNVDEDGPAKSSA
jgi:hypothetical protein